MKKETHPKYQDVLFVDSSTGHRFVIGSALQPKQTEKFEGKEYPVYQLSTSSYSHPFFTGSNKLVDAEGRIDKFKKRYMTAQQRSQEEQAQEAQKESVSKENSSREDASKKKLSSSEQTNQKLEASEPANSQDKGSKEEGKQKIAAPKKKAKK